MTRHWMMTSLVVAALAGVPTTAAAQAKQPEPKLPAGFASKAEVWGYGIGWLLGRDMKARLVDYTTVDWVAFTAGFELGIHGRVIDARKNAKVGYLLGHWIGVAQRKKLGAYLPFVSAKQLARGYSDGVRGRSSLDIDVGEDAIFELQEAMIRRLPVGQQKSQLARVKLARERARKKRAKTKVQVEAGTAFRTRYLATHKDAKTTASGLIYRVITPGSGRHPIRTEAVKVHYFGKLIDGTEFDTTYKDKTPVWFNVAHGLPGWVEALLMMKVGAKWEIVLPASLAYDHRGAGQIKPGSTLVFQIEMFEIGTPPKPAPPKLAPPKPAPRKPSPPKK